MSFSSLGRADEDELDTSRPSNALAGLCFEALGPLAPSLVWCAKGKYQMLHNILLFVIGLYALSLPRIRPKWLEENVLSQGVRAGGDITKHEELLQIVANVLAILNYKCLVMIILACRTTKSSGVQQLVQQTCSDKTKHAAAVVILRTSYTTSASVMVLIVLIFAAVGVMSDFPHASCFIVGWSPAFIPMWVMLQLVTLIRFIAFLSLSKVEDYYSDLEARGAGCIEAQDFAHMVKAGDWLQLLRQHQELVTDLTKISRGISSTVLICQNVFAFSSLLLLWVARAYRKCPQTSSMYVLLAFVLACYGLMAMLPLAAITDLCQSKRLGRRSLRNLADKYSGWPMSLDVHAEYMRFMQHVNTAHAGIYIPTMGLVTKSSLTHKIMFYVKVLPFALVVTLGWWSRG